MTRNAIGIREAQLPVARGIPERLSLAAAPTFALMALLTGVFAGGSQDVLCSAAHDASPLNGMVVMYLLMSAFHAAPWLRLMSNRHGGARSRPHAMDTTRPQSWCAATR
jgi:hypothetical protein